VESVINQFVTESPQSRLVTKEYRKLVNIWRSYGHE